MLRRRNERGDTLIEVLFAVAVFSFIVVGALSIMNQGLAASQRALEITLVRQQVDAQAESLRFMHDAYVAVYRPGITFDTTDSETTPAEEWSRMITSVRNTGIEQASSASSCPERPQSGSFIINTRTARFEPNSLSSFRVAETYARTIYDGDNVMTSTDGLWIEAVRSPDVTGSDANTGFIDFHIRACWDTVGQGLPITVGTIVRLYEPRG